MFDYDWFHGHQFREQKEEAKWRCTARRFPDVRREDAPNHPEVVAFADGLRTRTLVYLRDGFSYELKSIADVQSKAHLTFECEPVDEQYKVGAFVISVPFEDIVRVEVFAVAPEEMPAEMTAITGFRSRQDQTPHVSPQ